MAVGTQVTSTTIESQAAYDLGYWLSGLKSPVFTGVGSMDLVTGAAVLMSWVGITGFNLVEAYTRGNAFAELGAGMAERTALVAALFNKGNTRTMQGLLPGGSLAGDEGRVIVALGTGQICG
jgi:hypothetical protein